MSKNVTIAGATYQNVPAIVLRTSDGGSAQFVDEDDVVDTSDATATYSDLLEGKTAYANGEKIIGTVKIQKYYTGSTTPSSSFGSDGDLYLKVV